MLIKDWFSHKVPELNWEMRLECAKGSAIWPKFSPVVSDGFVPLPELKHLLFAMRMFLTWQERMQPFLFPHCSCESAASYPSSGPSLAEQGSLTHTGCELGFGSAQNQHGWKQGWPGFEIVQNRSKGMQLLWNFWNNLWGAVVQRWSILLLLVTKQRRNLLLN